MQTKALFFALLFSFSLAAADGVSPDACADRPIVESADLIEQGRQLFMTETFGGNGRTCATCHREENNFALDPAFIAKLPASDPLFVAERVPALKNLENSKLLRSKALILENLDGFDRPPVFRSVQTINGLRKTMSIGVNDSVTGQPVHETGWSGDGAPGDGSLRCFAVGAVVQHFPKRLDRVAGVDFRFPTEDELDALLAFQLNTGRQETPSLSTMKFRNADVQTGAFKFSNAVMKTRKGGTDARRCGGCHVDGGAGDQEPRQLDRQRVTNVSGSPNAPICSTRTTNPNDPVTIDGGLGSSIEFLESLQCGRRTVTAPFYADIDFAGTKGSFNIQSVWEAVETAPFFHDHSAKTVEDVLDFYESDAFNASEGNVGRAFVFTPDDRRQLAALLRVMSVLENIRATTVDIGVDRIDLAKLDTADALNALIASNTYPDALSELKLVKAALSKRTPDTSSALAHLSTARALIVDE